MFLRDNEMARGSGGNRRDDRVRVLQLAREKREARSRLKEQEAAVRHLQAFIRGRYAARHLRIRTRAEFDQKLSDIANLKIIVQQPNMALPYDVLFELLRLVLYFYTGRGEDAERLLKLSSLFVDALAGDSDQVKGIMGKQREWQLRRLIDLCLQCSSSTSAIVDVSVGFKTIRAITGTLPEMQRYLLSGQLLLFHPMQQAQKTLYSELPRTTVTLIVRQGLMFARGHLPISSRAKTSMYCNALVDFVVHLFTTTGEIFKAFVMEVFSVPLLNQVVAEDRLLQLTNMSLWTRLLSAGLHLSVFDFPASPVLGITSEAWFLGNILWVSDRVENKPDSVVLSEVRLLSKLLQSVPPATYSLIGGGGHLDESIRVSFRARGLPRSLK
ncbi:unnamed protein product [Peronospora destructor]|uniref:HECT-type E3 ubiquitin transferase n=1 Tax=Peronospora destructor TaxID=86335 RepID=A0AAV0V4F6_9STRA|nr:unnamed protein product [Peronospora destructor]